MGPAAPSDTDRDEPLPRAPPAELPEPRLSENALVVLRRRYLERDIDGTVRETPREMFWRVARHVAQAEARYGRDPMAHALDYYHMMTRLEFVPSSPTLMNAGQPLGQLAACFVLPIEDSLESIFETLKHTALVHQSGGGTGFDFSSLRPAGDRVRTTHGVASGPLSFLRIYNATTEEIKQGGTRRGANMGVLRVDHPDILAFIEAKGSDPMALRNFNVSVAITDDFLHALQQGGSYDLVHPKTGQSAGQLEARKVWHKIAQSAWESGEPGLLFVDRVNDLNPLQGIETIAATNPCGEQGLAPYDSCILGSIDLARHVRHEAGRAQVDWDKLRETATLAVRFLDDVLEMQHFPIEQIREKTLANRRIGLGVMGFARLLFRLGIPYDSEEARDVAEQVMAFIENNAHAQSRALAEERGVFPNHADSTWGERGIPMRNAAVTTVAPTGTIGMIADTSGGCEPEFSLVYIKRCLDGTTLPFVVPELAQVARAEGWWREGLLEEIAGNGGRLHGIDGVPEKWQRVFVTAHDIAPADHVRMQAAFQKHVDNAVSKTINLPADSSPEDVETAYRLAYELGCKGITVYRHGSRPDQVLDLQPRSEKEAPTGSLPEDGVCYTCEPVPPRVVYRGGDAKPATAVQPGEASGTRAALPRDRPLVVSGRTHKVPTGCGDVYVTINRDAAGPIDVIAVRARVNACTHAHLEATGRMASLALRWGTPLEAVAKTLKGVRCAEPHIADHGITLGCVDAIGQALEREALDPDGPQHEVLGQEKLDRYVVERSPVASSRPDRS